MVLKICSESNAPTGQSNQYLQIKINGTGLEVDSRMKYLGALLDNSFDWKDQVRAVFKGF